MSAHESDRRESSARPPKIDEPAVTVTKALRPNDASMQLATLLDEYLAELQAGRQPDRQKLLAEHPELASQLEQCLSGIEFIHQASTPRLTSGTPAQLGDFRIVREVGRGGMGVVYEAEQISLKRRVALKVLRYGAAADTEAMKRFQREAETVAGLHHTNIVPIFAIGCEQGVNYYAMQFIEGKSLADAVVGWDKHRAGPPDSSHSSSSRWAGAALAPPYDIATWGLQAAEALAHAHQRGVIHRDIKPSNLILDPDGRIWLTDFGLAKRMDDVSLSIAGTVLGTPRYMSPEQAAAAKQPVDHRTDIYSLGATLYELATGRPLFEADSPHAVITQILTTEPPAPRVICPNLPRDFETIILKCLSKEPERRYATAQALADDLRAFVEGRAIKARRSTLAEQAARWFKQQKRSVGVAAATVAATIFLVVGSLIAWQMHSQAQLGYLTLETPRDDALRADVAEVLSLNDEPIGSPFTLPTKEPVALPAGAYRLRLTAPSKVSRDYLFDVAAGQQMKFDVGLANETVGYALPLKSPVGVEVVQSSPVAPRQDSRTSIDSVRANDAQATDSVNSATGFPVAERQGYVEPRLFVGPQDQSKPTLRCFAANAQLGWNPDGTRQTDVAPLFAADWRLEAPGIVSFLKLPEDKEQWKVLPAQTNVFAWQQVWEWFKPGWWRNGTPPQVVRPMRDLNGDGVEDVIWSAPQSAQLQTDGYRPGPAIPNPPVLLAASGKDGQPLWWFRPQDAAGNASRLVKEPIWCGESLVSVLGSTATGDSWIEAISAKSGESLWRHGRFTILPQSSAWLAKTSMPDGSTNIVFVGGSQLVVLNAQTGAVQPSPQPQAANSDNGNSLSLRPNEPILDARFADFDGDGVTEALLTVQTDGRGIRDIAFSVTQGKSLWEVPSSFEVGAWHQNEPRHGWPLLADLDGDDKPEVILPGLREEGSNVSDGCRVLNGVTGELRWTRRFPRRGGFSHRKPEQFTIGPDLDGDGQRELVMASIRSEFGPRMANQTASHHYEECVLYVDCFSGRDGRSLWWQRIPLDFAEYAALTGVTGEMLWWSGAGFQPAREDRGIPDGQVENLPHGSLVIPIHRHPDTQQDGGTHSIFMLNAATGRIEHQADDMAFPQLVDWNNDGLDDLAVFVPDDPVRFEQRYHHPDMPSGKFVVLRGSPPEAFRRLDRWVEEQDFDGDGIAELSKPIGGMGIDYAVQIASGRDGRITSRWKTEWPETPRSWTVGEPRSFPPPLGDFDGDGLADLLLVRESRFWEWQDDPSVILRDGKIPLLIQAISSKTGRRAWGGPSLPLPEPFRASGADRAAFDAVRNNSLQATTTQPVDLDRDGRPELLQTLRLFGQRFPEPRGPAPVEHQQEFLALIDGRNGSLRWAEPFTELLGGNGYLRNSNAQVQVDATADLNADGTRDILVVVPTQDAQGWWTGTLQARNGRDGKPLWPAQPIDGKWVDASGLKRPLIGDLDGDGRPEIVLYETIQPQLCVLRGDTGETLWTWKSSQNLTQMTPEVVLVQSSRHAPRDEPFGTRDCTSAEANESQTTKAHHAERDGYNRHVAVTFNETGNQWELVLLDHDGKAVERVPYQSNQVWSHDLDGDGGEELLRFVDNKLTASRGLHDVLWTWSPPPFGYVHLSRFDRASDGRAIVVTSSGDSLTLLDGPTGKPLGRTFKSTNTSLTENNRVVDLNHARLAEPFENSRLLTRAGEGPMFNHIVSRGVLPTDESGRFSRPCSTRVSDPAVAATEGLINGRGDLRSGKVARSVTGPSAPTLRDDPRLVRRLMWAPTPAEWAAQRGRILQYVLLVVGLSFVIVLIPYWLIRAGILRRELGWWRAAMIFTGATIITASVLLFRLAPPGAIWRDVPFLLPVVMAVGGLPILLYPTAIFRAFATGNWRRIRWLLIGTLVLTALLASIQMGVDLSRKPPEQHYSWFGWWMIFVMGAYVTGGCLVLSHAFSPGIRWLWNLGRGRFTRYA